MERENANLTDSGGLKGASTRLTRRQGGRVSPTQSGSSPESQQQPCAPVERSVDQTHARRALELFGSVGRVAGSVKRLETVMRRYLGRVEHHLSQAEHRGLERLATSTCKERSPTCAVCPLRSFCAAPHQPRHQRRGSRFIDLFCGAGGLSLGLECHGFTPRLAVDVDAAALESYSLNRSPRVAEKVLLADVASLRLRDIPRTSLVVGGPPCQGFSNANKQPLTDDPRNRLYKRFLEITEAAQANTCVMENVPGISRSAPAVIRDMAAIGLTARMFTLDSADLGYPQYRKRVFFVGVRGLPVQQREAALEFFGRDLIHRRVPRRFALGDAIGDLPTLKAKPVANATLLESAEWGFTIAPPTNPRSAYARLINAGVYNGPLLNHRSKFNNPRDVEIYRRLTPGEGSTAESIRDIMPYASRAGIFKDKFFKLIPDRPCKTITAHMYFDCHMYIHPWQARGLTPREAARVQGFPDWYRFAGYPNQWYRQIGNAVSPLVAWHVGYALRSLHARFPAIRGED
jgi:DNA (cytosine-5)-methyltransferase 1